MVNAFENRFQFGRVFGEEMMHHRIAPSEHVITNPLGFLGDLQGRTQFTEQLAERLTQFVAKFIEFGGVPRRLIEDRGNQDQSADRCELDEGEIICCKLVIARRDARSNGVRRGMATARR